MLYIQINAIFNNYKSLWITVIIGSLQSYNETRSSVNVPLGLSSDKYDITFIVSPYFKMLNLPHKAAQRISDENFFLYFLISGVSPMASVVV